jgi:hypothetical protein
MTSLKTTWLLSLTIFLASCASSSSLPTRLAYPKPAAPSSLKLTWSDHGDRVSLNKDDAIRLMHWLLEVEAFLDHS